jgi:hypothetical protein
LYILPITDEAEGWEEEEPLVQLPLPVDVILKVIGIGDEGELEELEKILLREFYWVDRTIFLLPILEIGVALGNNPLRERDVRT